MNRILFMFMMLVAYPSYSQTDTINVLKKKFETEYEKVRTVVNQKNKSRINYDTIANELADQLIKSRE